MKTTAWYPGHVCPVRVGVYQRRFANGQVLYARWDGELWDIACNDADAAGEPGVVSLHQSGVEWRGLAHPTNRRTGPSERRVMTTAILMPNRRHPKHARDRRAAVVPA